MDTLSRQARSERMARVRGTNTKPEMTVRRLVHSLGYRYRLHDHRLPGVPDLVFAGRCKLIFVHGCFWHRHGDGRCKLARLPKSRLNFWIPKLEGNRLRDRKNRARLSRLGWRALTIWECQLTDVPKLTARITRFLEAE